MSTSTVPREGAATSTGTSTFWSATRLVAEREINAQIRTKGFWISIGMFVVGIFAITILPGIFGGGATAVATVGAEAQQALAGSDFEITTAADQAEAEELVRAGDVAAAVVPDPNGESATGLRIVALDDAPYDVIEALSTTPPIDLLDPAAVSGGARYLVTFGFALIFLMFAMYGVTIAQSVVTEKQTRIVEILLATIPVRALLAGKLTGHSLLVFGQAALLALVTPLALRAGDQGPLLTMIGPALGWFVPFFILGFLLLAGMWVVAGSVVSRQEDLGSSSTLVMMLALAPYLGVIILQGNALAMKIMSFVPFSAAVAMPVRLFTGDAEAWEPVASLVLLAATAVACVLLASRFYTGSVLQTGGRVSLRQAWSSSEALGEVPAAKQR